MPLSNLLAAPSSSGVSAWDILASVGQTAGAVGTFAAVVVALWLARRETQRRAEDEGIRALAQARLVRLENSDWGVGEIQDRPNGFPGEFQLRHRNDPSRAYFNPLVLNAGDRPITDVELHLWIEDLRKEPIKSKPADVMLPGDSRWVWVGSTHPGGTEQIALRLVWADAGGRRWYRDVLPSTDVQPAAARYTGQPPQRFM